MEIHLKLIATAIAFLFAALLANFHSYVNENKLATKLQFVFLAVAFVFGLLAIWI